MPRQKTLIGTSGFLERGPRGEKQWFKIHRAVPSFNCLEVNSSFYAMPTSRTVAKMAETYPASVQFIVKVNKRITHVCRLNAAAVDAWQEFVAPFANSPALQRRIHAWLLQLPPTFTASDDSIARLRMFAKGIRSAQAGVRIAIEFRHASWINDRTYALCRELNWCVVGTYVQRPDNMHDRRARNWMGTMPTGLWLPPATSDMTYIRVHGGPRWRGTLTRQELRGLLDAATAQGTSIKAFAFNNVFFPKRGERCVIEHISISYSGICNALQLTDLL